MKKKSLIFLRIFINFFSVQKVYHNYDLNPKFEQKNFKNEDRPTNSISKEKMVGNKRKKKNQQKTNSSKKSGRLPNIIQTQFVPKTRKTYIFSKKSGGNVVVFFIFYILKIHS